MSSDPADSLSVPSRRLLALGAQTCGPDEGQAQALRAQLAGNPLFADLHDEGLALLASHMELLELPVGVTFIEEGDAGDFLVFLMSGSVDVVRRGARGEPTRVAQTGAGNCLGEMSLFDGAPRFASCVSLEPCRVAVLGRESLGRLLDDHPVLGNRLLLSLVRLLSERLRQTGARLVGEAPLATSGGATRAD